MSNSLLALCMWALAMCTFLHLKISKGNDDEKESNILKWTSQRGVHSVPFFYIPPSSAKNAMFPLVGLYRIVENYKDNIDKIISTIVFSQDIARKSEWDVFPDAEEDDNGLKRNLFSSRLEDRVKRTAEVLELDYFILQKMLQPFRVTDGLPYFGEEKWMTIMDPSEDKTPSYDSAVHVITHIVRDWSKKGRRVRDSLYHWSISELIKYSTRDMPVLVPGSGLARLAHDIYMVGFNVEANELSISMSAAAYRFLNGEILTTGIVHPFAFDALINEVKSADRYQAIEFPDTSDDFLEQIVAKGGFKKGSLSYTIGDFVEIYAQSAFKSKYGSVVTCFFIDTATNIFEYLLVIRNVLKHGGIWINVGPLQWHHNAKVHPSSDELKLIIESMGFRIDCWSVDKEAINYRNDDGDEDTRYTKHEGYRPLRFVATLLPSVKNSLEDNVGTKIMRMRMRGVVNSQPSSDALHETSPISHVTITELS